MLVADEDVVAQRRYNPPLGDLSGALAAWSRAIGAGNVDASNGVCQRYGRSTSPWSQEPIAVVRPATVAEVQEVMRIAGAYRCPIYPISGGKNWGLGDACPTTAGQVVLDLRRLNAIREVNEELGYAVVEAGVTQRQLFEHLRAHAPSLMLDVTGAGPDATIVGNVMERGFGHSPYGDRYHNSCNYEVVLADGELLRTGFGRFPNAKAAHLLKAGLGPSLDGLFTQSNLGVVTSMTVWLLPRPQRLEAFAFTVDDDEALPAIVDALRPLRLQGILPSTVHIANDLRVISSKTSYPWDRTGGATPLTERIRGELRREFGVGAWNVLGALYGTPAIVGGARQALKRAMRGIATPRFVNEGTLKWAHRLAAAGQRFGLARRLSRQLESIDSAFALLNGEPTPHHLRGVGWRTRRATSSTASDPLDRGDGLVWLSPTLPMTGGHAVLVKEIAGPILESFGFDVLLTYVSISGRAMCCPLTVCYDGRSDADRRRAAGCYEQLTAAMVDQGYLPYRLGVQSMSAAGLARGAEMSVVRGLKRALDPRGLVAPGRYSSAYY